MWAGMGAVLLPRSEHVEDAGFSLRCSGCRAVLSEVVEFEALGHLGVGGSKKASTGVQWFRVVSSSGASCIRASSCKAMMQDRSQNLCWLFCP